MILLKILKWLVMIPAYGLGILWYIITSWKILLTIALAILTILICIFICDSWKGRIPTIVIAIIIIAIIL